MTPEELLTVMSVYSFTFYGYTMYIKPAHIVRTKCLYYLYSIAKRQNVLPHAFSLIQSVAF